MLVIITVNNTPGWEESLSHEHKPTTTTTIKQTNKNMYIIYEITFFSYSFY